MYVCTCCHDIYKKGTSMGQYMGVLCCSVLVPVNARVELLLEPVEGRLVCKSFRDNITAVRAASV